MLRRQMALASGYVTFILLKYKINEGCSYYILSIDKNKLFLKALLICNIFFWIFLIFWKSDNLGKNLIVENFIEISIVIH